MDDEKHRKQLDSQRRYSQSEKGKQKRRLRDKKYRKTTKYKIFKKNYDLKYSKTIKNKLYRSRYRQTKKYKDYQKRYSKTLAYKQSKKKYKQSPLGKYKSCSHQQVRRERLNNCIRSFSKEEWILKCKNTKGICPECKYPFDNGLHKLTLDHILSLFWANEYFKQTGIKFNYTIDYVQPLCGSCNSRKHKKLIV
jgi:hypothetical protein